MVAETEIAMENLTAETKRLVAEGKWTESLRARIRKRQRRQCLECGKHERDNGQALSVHHIDGNQLNNDPANLIALCKRCHRKRHPATHLGQVSELQQELARAREELAEAQSGAEGLVEQVAELEAELAAERARPVSLREWWGRRKADRE